MEACLDKLQKACLKINKEVSHQMIGKISSLLVRKEAENTGDQENWSTDDHEENTRKMKEQFECILRWIRESQNEEYFFKISVLRILETVCISFQKLSSQTLKNVFAQELEHCLIQAIQIVSVDLDENTVSGSYISDMKKVVKEWRRTFPKSESLTKFEQDLTEMEQRILESRKMRIDAIKRIEEDREKHKKIRERSWRKVYASSPPPPFILPGSSEHYQKEQNEDFEDAFERISDFGEHDYELIAHHVDYFNICQKT